MPDFVRPYLGAAGPEPGSESPGSEPGWLRARSVASFTASLVSPWIVRPATTTTAPTAIRVSTVTTMATIPAGDPERLPGGRSEGLLAGPGTGGYADPGARGGSVLRRRRSNRRHHRRRSRLELVELAGDQVQLPHALGSADVAEPDVAVRIADPALAGSALDPRDDRVALVILWLPVNVVHVRTVGRDRRRRTGLGKGATVPSWETC